MYKAMTIAGSDTSGGAGMEADLKTFQEMSVYGMVALTCIVAENPDNDWAHEIYPIETPVIEKQIHTIFGGIGADAMKTGMLGSRDLVEVVADTIDKYRLEKTVIDPVMVCKGIDTIMVPEAAEAIKEILVSRAYLMTPNLLEAAYLAGMERIETIDDMKEAAARICDKGCRHVVVKAGDRLPGNEAVEIFYDGNTFTEKRHPKLEGVYNHGAGCTFSAAITAGLSKGLPVKEAVLGAETFTEAAIKKSFRINQWAGALFHAAWREK